MMAEMLVNSNAITADQTTHDTVVFENVADQYVKGEDVHLDFTILNNSKIHPDEDRIGLIRVN